MEPIPPFSDFLFPPPSNPSTFANPPPPPHPLNGEEPVLSGVKLAVAMVSLLILIVALIVALRNCKNKSSNGAQGGVASSGSQIAIQLSEL
ncbi:hypothetical protein ACB092_01G418100 [Castanea dentata]